MSDDDDAKPMTFGRALRSAEFWLLLVAAACSMSGLRWWVVVPLTVAGLSVSSLPKYIELWPRARDVGAAGAWWLTVGLSMLNSLAAAVGCVLLGHVTRWIWF